MELLYYPSVFFVFLQLFRLFRKYAKRYPQLGMTPEELKEFLINECYVSPETPGVAMCMSLYHAQSYALLSF